MHTRDRGVDRDDPVDLPRRVRLLLHLGKQLLPGAVLGPPVEPLVDRVPLPEPLRHIAPWRPRPVLPGHALDREPVIRPRPRPPRYPRHQRLHHGPHLVRNLLSRHPPRLTQRRAKPLDQHALAVATPNAAIVARQGPRTCRRAPFGLNDLSGAASIAPTRAACDQGRDLRFTPTQLMSTRPTAHDPTATTSRGVPRISGVFGQYGDE